MENTKTVQLEELPFSGVEQVASVYVNNADTSIGPWDIRLLFSEIIGIGNPPEVQKILRASVAMSPAHAKALVSALINSVKAYERTYGEIKMPQAPESDAVKS